MTLRNLRSLKWKKVRKGDSLSTTLFNLALEHVTRNINRGTLRTRGGQIVAYADDIVLITDNQEKRNNEGKVERITVEAGKLELRLNECKTKMMRFGRKS